MLTLHSNEQQAFYNGEEFTPVTMLAREFGLPCGPNEMWRLIREDGDDTTWVAAPDVDGEYSVLAAFGPHTPVIDGVNGLDGLFSVPANMVAIYVSVPFADEYLGPYFAAPDVVMTTICRKLGELLDMQA